MSGDLSGIGEERVAAMTMLEYIPCVYSYDILSKHSFIGTANLFLGGIQKCYLFHVRCGLDLLLKCHLGDRDGSFGLGN